MSEEGMSVADTEKEQSADDVPVAEDSNTTTDAAVNNQDQSGDKTDKEENNATEPGEKTALLDETNNQEDSKQTNISNVVTTNLDEKPQNGVVTTNNNADPSVTCSIRRLFSPVMFKGERPYSLLRPRFLNQSLEHQYRLSYFNSETFRFRAALVYFLLFLFVYFAFFTFYTFASDRNDEYQKPAMNGEPALAVTSIFAVLIAILLVITFTPVYNSRNYYIFHYTFAAIILALPLFALGNAQPESMDVNYSLEDAGCPMTPLTTIFIVFIILYTVTSIPVMVVAIFGCLYSLTFEVLYYWLPTGEDVSPMLLVTRLLMHMCVHVLGVHFSHFYSSRKRELFNKKGDSILACQEQEKETAQMMNLIYSVMPKEVAEFMMEKEEEQKKQHKIFRELYVEVLEDVSILFADIVGFTNMSSGKTAEELVDLLNDLYGRFDKLAEEHGCEKIATLGDCYYCVSGCPKPRTDHAKCCIHMGLAMIQAINEFDEDRHQSVKMRVGIHTGKVICGVVGSKRHKFDILSDDVFIANDMESSGEPTAVHISEYTKIGLENAGMADMFNLKEFKPEEEKSSKLSRRSKKKTYLVSKKYNTDDAASSSPSKKAPGKEESGAPVKMAKLQEETAAIAAAHEETPLPVVVNEEALADNFDNQLISLLRSKPTSIQIFSDTPINRATLWFSSDLEHRYKNEFKQKNIDEVKDSEVKCTAFIYDLLPTCLIYVVLSFCLIVAAWAEEASLSLVFWLVFLLVTIVVAFVMVCQLSLFCGETKYGEIIGNITSSWVVTHIIGVFMLCAPVFVLFAWGTCWPNLHPYFFYATVLLWIHFANYPRLSTIVKIIILSLCIAVVCIPVTVRCLCTSDAKSDSDDLLSYSLFSGRHPLASEIVVQYVLILVFVWMVSMDFETMVRANFHANIIKEENATKLEEAHKMTETKLSNIMPQYVMSHFKATGTRVYSASRENVGIVFFFVDFWASYSEEYKSGAEYIRLLNELVSDFDALLDIEKYKNIEKIKTISSTYMAASNLDPTNTDPWMTQLCSLMEFTLDLKKKLILFCQDIPGQSTYISKGGINYGNVTAGVIGTSKLHFDIWGDAVNVSSRMYSTGDANMIQMTEKMRNVLVEGGWPEDRFAYRKKVFVKGKGEMDTHQYTKQEESEDMSKYYFK